MSHHESDSQSRLVDQFLNRALTAFPDGPINRTDQGELAFAVAADPVNRVVLIHFGKPVVWAGMSKQQAITLSDMLREKAQQLP